MHHWRSLSRLNLPLVAVVAVLSVGCSSPSPGGGYGGYAYDSATAAGLDVVHDASASDTAGAGASICGPGATQLCHCTATTKGVQICAVDGASWLACACEAAGDVGTDAGAEDAGAADAGVTDAGSPQQDASGATDNCDDRARQVYVLSDANDLLRFLPDKLTFEVVGKLNCSVPGGSPFSMSVDRQATAWVLYQKFGAGGGLFEVSTENAACKATTFKNGQNGYDLFGMGFSANSKGSQQETLFIAGGSSSLWNKTNGKLGTVGIPGLNVTHKAVINVGGGSPELTGDGDGKLWGFFPQSVPPSVRQIDKTTGKTGKTFPLPSITLNNVQAWAFARWGGSFYLFFKSQLDSSSAVFKVDPVGNVSKVIAKTGYNIVGAGVSSCAPTSALASGP